MIPILSGADSAAPALAEAVRDAAATIAHRSFRMPAI
jgi:hypothetical protein